MGMVETEAVGLLKKAFEVVFASKPPANIVALLDSTLAQLRDPDRQLLVRLRGFRQSRAVEESMESISRDWASMPHLPTGAFDYFLPVFLALILSDDSCPGEFVLFVGQRISEHVNRRPSRSPQWLTVWNVDQKAAVRQALTIIRDYLSDLPRVQRRLDAVIAEL